MPSESMVERVMRYPLIRWLARTCPGWALIAVSLIPDPHTTQVQAAVASACGGYWIAHETAALPEESPDGE